MKSGDLVSVREPTLAIDPGAIRTTHGFVGGTLGKIEVEDVCILLTPGNQYHYVLTRYGPVCVIANTVVKATKVKIPK